MRRGRGRGRDGASSWRWSWRWSWSRDRVKGKGRGKGKSGCRGDGKVCRKETYPQLKFREFADKMRNECVVEKDVLV